MYYVWCRDVPRIQLKDSERRLRTLQICRILMWLANPETSLCTPPNNLIPSSQKTKLFLNTAVSEVTLNSKWPKGLKETKEQMDRIKTSWVVFAVEQNRRLRSQYLITCLQETDPLSEGKNTGIQVGCCSCHPTVRDLSFPHLDPLCSGNSSPLGLYQALGSSSCFSLEQGWAHTPYPTVPLEQSTQNFPAQITVQVYDIFDNFSKIRISRSSTLDSHDPISRDY